MTDPLPLLESCDGCGACCRHVIAPPFVLSGGRDEAAEKGVPAALIDELRPLWESRFFLPEAPCLWFDETTLRCRHYELRPDACRDFERNGDPCRECRRKWSVA